VSIFFSPLHRIQPDLLLFFKEPESCIFTLVFDSEKILIILIYNYNKSFFKKNGFNFMRGNQGFPAGFPLLGIILVPVRNRDSRANRSRLANPGVNRERHRRRATAIALSKSSAP
jgi:hypothetical protein